MNFPFSHPQVALCGACLLSHPCPLHDRKVASSAAPTTQGTRCGARRKDGDGYGSLTSDHDNTHLLTSEPHKSHFHLDKQFVRVV